MFRRPGPLIATISLLLSLEISAYILFNLRFKKLRTYTVDYVVPRKNKFERAKRIFHPYYGWRIPFETTYSERPQQQKRKTLLASSYGDSFVYCSEASQDETWQEYAATELRSAILNFGVPASGPDQALLRFESEYEKHRSPFSILGFIPENINRLSNTYRAFYQKRTSYPLSKPRFQKEDGKYILKKNPLQKRAELYKLYNLDFLTELGQNDYWYHYNQRRHISFPYSLSLMKETSREILFADIGPEAYRGIGPYPWHDLWKDEEHRELFFYVMRRFRKSAEERNTIPVYLLLPQKGYIEHELLSGKPHDGIEYIRTWMKENKVLFIDGHKTLQPYVHNNEELKSYYGYAHLNGRGNQIIGKEVATFFKEQLEKSLLQ